MSKEYSALLTVMAGTLFGYMLQDYSQCTNDLMKVTDFLSSSALFCLVVFFILEIRRYFKNRNVD